MIEQNKPYRRPAPGMEPPKQGPYPRWLKIHIYPTRRERRAERVMLRKQGGKTW